MCCYSNAGLLDADEPHHRRFFGYMITILQRISNRVGGYELGTAHVRLDGLEGVYRSELGVASALLNPVPPYLNPLHRRLGREVPRVRRGPDRRSSWSVQDPRLCRGLPRSVYHPPATSRRRCEERGTPVSAKAPRSWTDVVVFRLSSWCAACRCTGLNDLMDVGLHRRGSMTEVANQI